jgi:hypothetical protein
MRNIGIHTEKSTDIISDLAIVIDKSFRKYKITLIKTP